MTDVYVPTDEGYFVSERHMRVAQIIQDYDETLSLVFIPPARRAPEDKGNEFGVVCTPTDGRPQYLVMHVSEDEVDHRLLARIFRGDTARTNVLGWIEAIEAGKEALILKEKLDKQEERMDLVQSIIRSPLNTYRHKGVKYQ